jgi:16S rRNA (cytosine1402-N4)-methyltransferase
VAQVLQTLQPEDGRVYVDLTFGDGGHTRALLNTGKRILVFTYDRDPAAFVKAQQLAQHFPTQVIPMFGRFSDLKRVFAEHRLKENSVDGVLIDVGVCWHNQLRNRTRGFCPVWSPASVIDMRMDGASRPEVPTAFDLLHTLDEQDLSRILSLYGNERRARKLADLLMNARQMLGQIRTAGELAFLIKSVGAQTNEALSAVVRGDDTTDSGWQTATGSTARLFYALRVFVNNELNELDYGLRAIRSYLKLSEPRSNETESSRAGRIAVISYTAPEDSVVKAHLSTMGTAAQSEAQLPALLSARARSSLTASTAQDAGQFRNTCWSPLQKHVSRLPLDRQLLYPPLYRTAKLRTAERRS